MTQRKISAASFRRFAAGQIASWRFLARFGRQVNLVVGGSSGIGDDFLFTALIRENHRRTGRRSVVSTRWPELFEHNPAVAGCLPPNPNLGRWLGRYGVPVAYPSYDGWFPHDAVQRRPEKHIIVEMALSVGWAPPSEVRPWLYLTEAERRRGERARGAILVQTSNQPAGKPNKQWYPERFSELGRRLLAEGCRVAQVGEPGDAPLGVGEDFRGTGTVREVAELLANARLFVGLVGSIMHLARAVDCPTVAVYGGREAPWQSGYDENENLYNAVPCAPCWYWLRCDFNRKCMDQITVEAVHAAVRRKLGQPIPTPS